MHDKANYRTSTDGLRLGLCLRRHDANTFLQLLCTRIHPTCLPTHPPTHRPIRPLPTFPPAYPPAYPPACLLTCVSHTNTCIDAQVNACPNVDGLPASWHRHKCTHTHTKTHPHIHAPCTVLDMQSMHFCVTMCAEKTSMRESERGAKKS